jgi:L-amino acid N-acyltransferase YncA
VRQSLGAAGKALMTLMLTFEDQAAKRRYTAWVGQWASAGCHAHEKMGFRQGSGQCADQLARSSRTYDAGKSD